MTTFRKTLLAALARSLVRGKSLLRALLAYWFGAIVSESRSQTPTTDSSRLSIQEFLKDAEVSLIGPVSGDGLLDLSAGLKEQFIRRLQADPECMIPAYSYRLPTGMESGQFLTLDVGGSTLRVAVVELKGRHGDLRSSSEIVSIRNYTIDKAIKDLEGMAFFDWMGARIIETISNGPSRVQNPNQPLPMALAWSFPIEQTSLSTGKLQGMGKGFMAAQGLLGEDLGDILQRACKNRGLNAEVQAILNDSSACLLSECYMQPSTRFGLILGTGFNVAAYLPVSSVGHFKFGVRPQSWFDNASHVIVNTELGMFGHNILPLVKWDRQLLQHLPRPDFQPLEYLVSGMYLGEIGRLALIDAIERTGIFGGVVPPSLLNPFALGTDMLAFLESDTSSELLEAKALFCARHPSAHIPTSSDLHALKALASFISTRSSALAATSVYTLWDLRRESQLEYISSLPEISPLRSHAELDMELSLQTIVGFNGGVIEKYPGYLNNCQQYLDQLVASKGQPGLALFVAGVVAASGSLCWEPIQLDYPLNWQAGPRLFPGNVIAGYNDDYDNWDAESWAGHIVGECDQFERATSTHSFSAINSGSGDQNRYWFGYCYAGGPTTQWDYVRGDDVEGSIVYNLVEVPSSSIDLGQTP
ncbi:Phosphotransferase [Paramyrothecium foliicola]|nr:Phosphotransferase [Paramyrothecium foliicola]